MKHVNTAAKSQPGRTLDGSDLTSRIRQIVKDEQAKERFVETFVGVAARQGLVQVPRTDHFYSTDQEAVWFTGTDDTTFKNFIEVVLPRLHKELLDSATDPYSLDVKAMNLGRPWSCQLNRLGREVVQCCAQYDPEWSIAYLNHVFDPAVTVMLRAMKRYATEIGHEFSGSGPQSYAMAKLLKRLVRFVRRASRTWRFINATREQAKRAKSNFNSARQFIYYLAEKHSRLLILRIDLYFRPYYDDVQGNKEITGYLRWLSGKACKRNLLPGFLGFMIKRENGLVRGHHWHLIILCDASVQLSGGYLTQRLGEMWAQRTGQGRVSYHNCWADRSKYKYDGLGVLELDDWEKMVGLRNALYYLSKHNCALKVTNSKVKNFWRSMIRKKYGSKRGKPRAEVDSLRLLKRMLGGKRSKYPPGFVPAPSTKRLAHTSVS